MQKSIVEIIEKIQKQLNQSNLNLNHLFQEYKTGNPAEYPTIEQTFSPLVMEDCTKWIKERTK